MVTLLKRLEDQQKKHYVGKVISSPMMEPHETASSTIINRLSQDFDKEKFDILVAKVESGKATINEQLELGLIIVKRRYRK